LKPEKLYFSVKEGGLICKNCFNKFDTGIEININAIKILRLIIKKDWKILEHIKINDEDEKCLEIISQNAILSIRN